MGISGKTPSKRANYPNYTLSPKYRKYRKYPNHPPALPKAGEQGHLNPYIIASHACGGGAERSEAKWACPAAPRANKAPKPLHFSRSCATICVVSSCPGVRGPRRGLLGCGQTGAGLRGRREGCRRLRRAASSPAAGRPLPPRSAEANLCRACPLQHSERRGPGFAALPAQFGWNRGAVFARLN